MHTFSTNWNYSSINTTNVKIVAVGIDIMFFDDLQNRMDADFIGSLLTARLIFQLLWNYRKEGVFPKRKLTVGKVNTAKTQASWKVPFISLTYRPGCP
jgi:hypothetical protein